MKITIILCSLLIVQYALTFIQVRSYRKSMEKIVSRYKETEGYYLFSSMEKRKFRPGAIAMIIVNNSYMIQECYVVNGFSVLSKFKEVVKYKGKHVGTLLSEVQENQLKTGKRHKVPAVSAALSKAAENALLSIAKKNITTN
ncbi:transcriptional regulator GutM [Neobacillus cucumis]|uniref:transcriptional regulator GutM n=1 Tax=Neobacillus cucumis TaxID=1740721 RepID=UPI00203AAC50|nr:transcriptional regulator GutM [Neobacillus cucumis]MCM3728175.1 transcriptional regulator GutM [Neobacillus cucumis]